MVCLRGFCLGVWLSYHISLVLFLQSGMLCFLLANFIQVKVVCYDINIAAFNASVVLSICFGIIGYSSFTLKVAALYLQIIFQHKFPFSSRNLFFFFSILINNENSKCVWNTIIYKKHIREDSSAYNASNKAVKILLESLEIWAHSKSWT